MLIIAIAPIVPILAAVGAGGIITGVWYFTSKDDTGELEPPSPGPQNGGTNGGETKPTDAVVEGLIGEYEDAAFHNTLANDSIDRVVLRTLNKIDPGAASSNSLFQGLRRLLNQSEWNRKYYGENMPNDPYRFEGQAVNRFASPKHEDAVGVMRTGFFPKRNINANGTRIGQDAKWGDLWIPALNHVAVKARQGNPEILLAPPWSDGRPATEPPPELLAVLRERQ